MKLHFVGTASGLPTPVRFSQTTVLEISPDQLYILDAGDGANGLMLRHGLDHNAVRGIVISHMHGDHYAGLVQLMKTMMHHKRSAPLIIYLPSEGIAPLRTLLEASYLIPELLGYPVAWIPIEAGRNVSLTTETGALDRGRGDGGGAAGGRAETQASDRVTVRAVVNQHLDHYRELAASLGRPLPWKYESFSFHIEAGGFRMAYVGNLHRRLDEVDPEFRGVDVLISELAHLQPSECLEALGRLRPRHAIFAHFNPRWDDRATWEPSGLARLGEGLDGVKVWLTEDGDTFVFDGKGEVRRERRRALAGDDSDVA